MAVNLPDSPTNSEPQSGSTNGTRLRNFLIALVAIALTIALSFGLRTQTNSVSLDAQAEASTPLEVAIGNGKPTLMEFYANWCTSCQAMAEDLAAVKQQYGEKLNFVMLNVDNTKWLPEMARYRVDGIPLFVFLGKDGQAIAQVIGEMPRPVIAANLDALVADLPLPYTQTNGQTSSLEQNPLNLTPTASDPRSHGSQVNR